MNSDLCTYLQKRLEKKLALLDSIETAMADAVPGGVQTFELDTGEADQKVIFRSLQSMQKAKRILEADIGQLMRRLNGTSMYVTRLRRK